MAFQIFWKIPFKSLRTGTDYTVNIYKDGALPSGYPLTLKGGAQPFVTEEDSDEDIFTPIRTQTGYLRFVDDGKAEDSSNQPQEVTFNWKDIIPSTDTARPVTLTHHSDGQTVVDWQGFMQAQDFGSTLYGNPQEREFPIQCVLSVTQGTDINYQQTDKSSLPTLQRHQVEQSRGMCESSVTEHAGDCLITRTSISYNHNSQATTSSCGFLFVFD